MFTEQFECARHCAVYSDGPQELVSRGREPASQTLTIRALCVVTKRQTEGHRDVKGEFRFSRQKGEGGKHSKGKGRGTKGLGVLCFGTKGA